MDFRCVDCGFHIRTLYIQYSLGNILLMKCGLLWKLAFIYLLLDACIQITVLLALSRSEDKHNLSMSYGTTIWSCGKMLVDLLSGNFVFVCVLLVGTRLLMNASIGISGCKDVLFAVLVSSYLKVFLIAMMVWEFPSSVLFIVDVFVLLSNVVALKGYAFVHSHLSFWLVGC